MTAGTAESFAPLATGQVAGAVRTACVFASLRCCSGRAREHTLSDFFLASKYSGLVFGEYLRL
jgi:hypothetical protein